MIPLFNYKLTQLKITAPTQTKLLVLIKTVVLQETLHGQHSALQELEIQLTLKLHHIQVIHFIYN